MTQKDDKSYNNLVNFWKNIESKNNKAENTPTEQTTAKKQENKNVKDEVSNILNKNVSVKETVKDEHKDKVSVVGQEGIKNDKKSTAASVTEKPKTVVSDTNKQSTIVSKSISVQSKGKSVEENNKLPLSKTKPTPSKEVDVINETPSNKHTFTVEKTQALKNETSRKKPVKGEKGKEKIHTERTKSVKDKKKETPNCETFKEDKTKTQKENKETKTLLDVKENKSELESNKSAENTKPPLLNEVIEQIKESKKILNGCKETLKECKEKSKKTEEEIQRSLKNLQTNLSSEEIPPKQVDPPKDVKKFRKRRVTIIDPDVIKRALETTDDDEPVAIESPKEEASTPKPKIDTLNEASASKQEIQTPKEEVHTPKQEVQAPKEEVHTPKQEVQAPKETSRRSRENRKSVINIQDLQMRQLKIDEPKAEKSRLTKEKELFEENSRLESVSLSDLKKETAPKPRARGRRMSVIDLARMYSNKSDDEDL